MNAVRIAGGTAYIGLMTLSLGMGFRKRERGIYESSDSFFIIESLVSQEIIHLLPTMLCLDGSV